jgi:hypothetical protein
VKGSGRGLICPEGLSTSHENFVQGNRVALKRYRYANLLRVRGNGGVIPGNNISDLHGTEALAAQTQSGRCFLYG